MNRIKDNTLIFDAKESSEMLKIKDILATAIERTSNGEEFEVTEGELEILGIKGLDPQYFDVIKISTEQ